MIVKLLLAIFGLISILSGCATLTQVDGQLQQAEARASGLKHEMVQDARSSALIRRDTPKIAGKRIPVVEAQALPAGFSESVFYTTSGQTLERILRVVSEMVGIPMRITEFAEREARAGNRGVAGGGLAQGLIDVAWSGSLEGLLDHLARATNLYWRYVPETRSVDFFLLETRHFAINLPSGARAISASISSAGGGTSPGAGSAVGGGTGGISSQLADQIIDPYAAITRTITSIILEDDPEVSLLGGIASGQGAGGSASGTRTGNRLSAQPAQSDGGSGRGFGGQERSRSTSRVVVSPELATVTVTAPPPTLDRVAAYLKRVNQQFARNLTIDLQVFDVALDDETGLGFSLEAVYQRMRDFGLSLTGGPAVPNARGPSGQLTFEVLDPGSRFSGTTLLAQALASFGSVSVATSGQVLALNGQPAPFQVAEEISFLASSSARRDRATASDIDPVTGLPIPGIAPLVVDLTPGSVVVGLTANFLPQILDDNRILLQYQLTVSELRSLNTITSGGASIQVPNIFSQSLQQQAILRDGQSIVLFGYEQDRAQRDSAVSLGGRSRSSSSRRSVRVIQIQVFGGGSNA